MSAATLGPEQRQAVMWEVRLREGGLSGPDLRAFQRWLDAAPAHLHAWEALQERLARISGAGAHDAAAAARALRTPAVDRRRALRTGFTLGLLATVGWGAREGYGALGLDADWRSAIAERGEGVLADGTVVAYDADSRIYLSGSAAAPTLDLRQGQLLLRAQSRNASELAVRTAHGLVTTRGATLHVGRLHSRSVIAVRDGGARLHHAGGAAAELAPGQVWYADTAGARPADLSFNAASAWTRGIFVADQLPLADLLEVFSRYRSGLIRAGGQAAALQISGVFRLDDIPRALRQVADVLPVRLSTYGRYLTVLA